MSRSPEQERKLIGPTPDLGYVVEYGTEIGT
jgi:hypothetical protein